MNLSPENNLSALTWVEGTEKIIFASLASSG
jgi:hypothetical protein